jgi:hypothetical protein
MASRNIPALRRRGGAPSLYNHRPDTATVVRISNDGRRAREETVRVERPSQAVPTYFHEDLETNAALDSQDFDYAMGDTSLDPEDQAPEEDGISVHVKAKRYENSVHLHCILCSFLSVFLSETEHAYFRICLSRLGPRAIAMSTWMRFYAGRAGETWRSTHSAEDVGNATQSTVARTRLATELKCSVEAVSLRDTRFSLRTGFRYVWAVCEFLSWADMYVRAGMERLFF